MPSAMNRFITNEEAVPLLPVSVFHGHEQARFALGVIDGAHVVASGQGTVAHAYLRLRANVYIDQTNMLAADSRRTDGSELDHDDARSTHFVVLENRVDQVAVFACARLIQKSVDAPARLPIEDYFPGAFQSSPAPMRSLEVSRFIVRHDEARHSRVAKREIMKAGLAFAFSGDLGPMYGVVEPQFERDLRLMGVPTARLASPKLVPEYNDENLAIEVDMLGVRRRLGERCVDERATPIGAFSYWGQQDACGTFAGAGDQS